MGAQGHRNFLVLCERTEFVAEAAAIAARQVAASDSRVQSRVDTYAMQYEATNAALDGEAAEYGAEFTRRFARCSQIGDSTLSNVGAERNGFSRSRERGEQLFCSRFVAAAFSQHA